MRRVHWLNGMLALLCSVAVLRLMAGSSAEVLRGIAGGFISVASTLLGFMIAALSILTALVDRRLVANLRKTGHYDYLLKELYWTSVAYLAALVLSLVSLFLLGHWLLYGISLTTAIMVVATVLLISSGHKFAMVMQTLR